MRDIEVWEVNQIIDNIYYTNSKVYIGIKRAFCRHKKSLLFTEQKALFMPTVNRRLFLCLCTLHEWW